MKTNLRSTGLPVSGRTSGVKAIAAAIVSFIAVLAVVAFLPIIAALARPSVSASSPNVSSTALSAAYTTQNEVELAHVRYALLRDQYRDQFDPSLR
jgi:hypothetical protein